MTKQNSIEEVVELVAKELHTILVNKSTEDFGLGKNTFMNPEDYATYTVCILEKALQAQYNKGVEDERKRLQKKLPKEKDMYQGYYKCPCSGTGSCYCEFSEYNGFNNCLEQVKKIITL